MNKSASPSPSRRRGRLGVGLAASALLLGSGILSTQTATAAPAALILADTNRDGVVTAADADGRGVWTKTRGAFFLANLDDDLARCPKIDVDGSQLTDVELASCNDAADRVVNGDADIADLARIKVAGVAAGSADQVRVELRGVGASKVNLFRRTGAGTRASDWKRLPANGHLPADQIRSGVELGLEGKDIIRDTSWDGTVTVRVVHLKGGKQVATDQVQLRVAPVLFATDLMPMQTIYAADNLTSVYDGQEAQPAAERILGTQVPFREDLQEGVDRIGKGVTFELLPSMQGARGGGEGTDIWLQDVMEPGFMSMPAPQGEQSMKVWVRAPVRDGRDNAGGNPFRGSGRIVFTELRGPDVAGVQHFDPDYEPVRHAGSSYDTFGSTGNYGTIPAHTYAGKSYPLGRKIFGSAAGGFTADPAFNAMLAAQGYQQPVVIDTSWLGVGHIDELLSFIPANTERGWAMVLADPQLAYDLLADLEEQGRGDEQLLQPYDFDVEGVEFPTTTISQTLADPAIKEGTRNAVRGINKALQVIKSETGMTEDDIIRVPVLYKGNRSGVAIPNAANLIGTGHKVVFVTKQHAPAVDGKDMFETLIEQRFAEVGTEIQWVEDYRYAHPSGEIHCTTNVLRDHTGGTPWWTEGSSTTAPAPKPTLQPIVQLTKPRVTGTFRVGRQIKLHIGKLNPKPAKVKVQWYAGNTPIKGATTLKLKLTKKLAGKRIKVSITASKPGHQTLTTVTTVGKKRLRK
ncbi:protein-arginine deiminase family protein [Nocardioides massiliensis]|uniref:Protein-arginine deiminase n=1 Tax=Nocardioides massiliensis TaxID=1325935 RepID=A0ABT9NIW1_9ACTN|nr:protein-arginine deiminase family protein [Nocardioides massiliensis]MDP9820357.1 protein-arginine deiminase [Nocardioides massiliensis]